MPKSKTQRTNLGIKYRGTVLGTCSVLEKEIEYFIKNYFVEKHTDKWFLMGEVFLDRFHFDGKIAVFEVLIKKSVEKDVFKKTFSKLFSELRYVKDERNKFAHYVQYVEDDNVDHITLLSFRDGVKGEDYNPEKYKLLIERIDRCIEEVAKMAKDVSKFSPLLPPLPL